MEYGWCPPEDVEELKQKIRDLESRLHSETKDKNQIISKLEGIVKDYIQISENIHDASMEILRLSLREEELDEKLITERDKLVSRYKELKETDKTLTENVIKSKIDAEPNLLKIKQEIRDVRRQIQTLTLENNLRKEKQKATTFQFKIYISLINQDQQ